MDPGKQESFTSTSALYNKQRQRMDAIRQTALALRFVDYINVIQVMCIKGPKLNLMSIL